MLISRSVRSAISVVVFALAMASAAHADIVVNTDVDEDTNNSSCSLREAITAVNTQADYNGCTDPGSTWSKVTFAIPHNSGEQHIISLGSALPAITQPVFIDATTQSGATCTPVPNLRVRVANGASIAVGLLLDTGSTGSKIHGLAMTNFVGSSSATGLWIKGDSATIGCVISGMEPTGTLARPNEYGLIIDGKFATIGEASAGAWFPNLISGNNTSNILLNHGADNALIAGNYVGVDHTGLTPVTTAGYDIYVDGSGTHIGVGFADGPPVHQRNIIGVTSNFSNAEIFLDTVSDTIISGNYIGVGVDGHTVLPIGGPTAGGGVGINLLNASNTLIGCNGIGSWDDCRNVLAVPSNGSSVNVAISAGGTSNGIAVVSNFINVAADGVTSLAGTSLYVHGIETGKDVLVARNVIRAPTNGTDIYLGSPDGTSPTAVFLNATPAGTGGATLDSSDNCLDDTDVQGLSIDNYMITPTPTTFTNNWWGAIDGPQPGGSGASADPAAATTPFLSARSPYCGFDRVFVDGFDG